ncbi:MAG: hypothetical protein JNK04_03340 [Myxococcales bacterium]|nr:hypothetical protein [Myxococcales bacterium]
MFDDVLVGTTATYTPTGFNDRLGMFDKISIQAIADQVSGTTPTLTVQIEHSGDQRNWSKKSGTAEISNRALVTTTTNVFDGSDGGAVPNHGFVRLAVSLGGTSPQAHVKIWVCLRDDS